MVENISKTILITGFSLFITACADSSLKYYEIEPILEVYPTNMNDCEAVVDTEEYINVDCRRRSVNRLTDEVHYIDEPALFTMQGLSTINSAINICKNLSEEEKYKGKHIVDDLFQRGIFSLYELDKHPEFKKEFKLISEKLEGKYDYKIDEKECLGIKETIESYPFKKEGCNRSLSLFSFYFLFVFFLFSFFF